MERQLLFLLMCPTVMCNVTSLSPMELVSEYLSNHNPLYNPVPLSKSILEVSVNFNLLHLEELDESKQTLTTIGWFFFTWTLEELSWNQTKFQNISRVPVSPKDIWLPDLVLANAYDNYGRLGGEHLSATINNNGTVEWYAVGRRSTSCTVNVTSFPFDSQRCSFLMAQWTTDTTQVNYTFQSVPMTITNEGNGEWVVLGTFVKKSYSYEGMYQVLEFGIILARRRAFYIMTAVLPVCVLSCLNLMVFHVPPESGEKMSLCVSVLLAYAVYLNSMNSFLPSVSDHVSLFNVYLHCMFVLKALTVVASVFVLYLYSALPTSTIRKQLTKRFPANPNQVTPGAFSTGNPDEANHLNDTPKKTNTNTEDVKHVLEQEQWFGIVKKVDLLFFCVFLMLFIVSTAGFFCTITFRSA